MIPDCKYRRKASKNILRNKVYSGRLKDDAGKELHPEFKRKPFGLKNK